MTNCEAVVVDDKNIPNDEFLISTILISPEADSIIAGVSHLLPARVANTRSSFTIPNATIVLTNLTTRAQKTFSYRRLLEHYVLHTDDFPIKQSETYRVEITVGDEKLTSQCYIPRHARHIRLRRIYDDGEDWLADISLRDVRGEENSYHIAIAMAYFPDGRNREVETITTWEYRSVIIDDEHDGEEYKLSLRLDSEIDERVRMYKEGTLNVEYLELYVLTSDWDYYNYQTAVLQDDDEVNPLFSEPRLLPKGFDNGYGIFSGYRVQTRKFSLDELLRNE